MLMRRLNCNLSYTLGKRVVVGSNGSITSSALIACLVANAEAEAEATVTTLYTSTRTDIKPKVKTLKTKGNL